MLGTVFPVSGDSDEMELNWEGKESKNAQAGSNN